MFSLHVFGGLKLLDGDGRELAFPEKGLLILAYLMMAPNLHAPRSTIAWLLWGRDDNGGAQVNLRKLVSRIRGRQAALGRSFLHFSESTVELVSPPSLVDCSLTKSVDAGSALAKLKLLAEAQKAEFLKGVDCQSATFSQWRDAQKHRQSLRLKEALKVAAEQANSRDEIALVKDVATLLLGSNPEDPDMHRILLRIFDAAGEVEHFRQVFERRNALLTSWLGRQDKILKPNGRSAIRPAQEVASAPRKLQIPLLLLSSWDRPVAGHDSSSLLQGITVGLYALESLDMGDRCTSVQVSRVEQNAAATFNEGDASYILDMRPSSGADEPRLFLQLVDAGTDEVLWAERIDVGQFSQKREREAITRHIVLSVAGQIERREMVRSHFDKSPMAYQRYLAGKRYLERLSVPNLQRARSELVAALRGGGDFAPGLSSVARTFSKEWVLTSGGDKALLDEAENYAMRAIAARHDIADGYRELGLTKSFQRANDESIEALKLAEALNPGHAGIIADHAEVLLHSSRPDLALEKIESAIALNPVSPDTYLWTASVASYTLGRFEAALDYIDRMADARLADRISAASWAMLGEEERAGFFVRRVHKTTPDFDVDRWVSVVPFKEQWQRDIYREGLHRAGFWRDSAN
ncbi:hypothetical protein [Rhizobium sp. BR 314]|uniref:hypothetical protein n=1 Tax=Rhizobium sp. BR 314 TaxID=3040013 RepID=UPI0039BF5E0C